MSDIVEQIKAELIAVAQAVGANAEQRALSLAYNQFGMAGVDRDQLRERALGLANWIDTVDSGELSNDLEKKLPEYLTRLQFLRTSTVPHIFNGNAQVAVPAYLITLESLERELRHFFAVSESDFLELSGELRNLQRKVRSLTAQTAAVQPKVEGLQRMANEIVRAYEAADRLPTDLEELAEARNQIEGFLDAARGHNSEMKGIVESADEQNNLLSISSTQAEKIVAQCEDAMRASTAVGLAGAFHDRAESLRKSLWPWVVGLIAALCVGAVVGGWQLHQLSETIQASTAPTIVWTRIAVSLLSVGAPVWFAWLATKQIGQRFRLAEDYAYKASISKAYEGYRREAAQLDEDFQKRLFSSALTRLDEQPLRFVEHETHGSPWHEFLSSDIVKDAIRIAPQLVAEWRQKATETVAAAKSRRKAPSKLNGETPSAPAESVHE